MGASLSGLRQWYEAAVPASVRAFLQQQFPSTPEQLLATLERDILVSLATTLRSSWAVIAGYLIVPFWLIYVLYDAGRFRYLRASPQGITPEEALLRIRRSWQQLRP